MAEYTPKTWQCGETITADALNNLEEGIQEALECCGSTDVGFECITDTEIVTAYEGVITTTASQYAPFPIVSFSLQQELPKQNIIAVYDGDEYTLAYHADGANNSWYNGEVNTPTETTPIVVLQQSGSANCKVGTLTAGEHSLILKYEDVGEVINTTDCFEKAVTKVLPSKRIFRAEETGANTGEYTFNTTAEQINEWLTAGEEVEAVVIKKYPYDGENYIWCPLAVKKLSNSTSWHFDFIGFNTNSHASSGATALNCYRIFANAGGLSIDVNEIEFRVTT